MTDKQVERMLNDTLAVEQDEVSLAADFACHIKALADDRERLLACLQMLAQVRHVGDWTHGTFRSHLAIMDAVIAGADVRRLEDVEAIAAGKWKAS